MYNKSNKKCILLVRVSTGAQSFDEQANELRDMARADGYSDNNIIAICHKESAIKLKEEERQGLTEMKELILSDATIDCVYTWEISRISRKKKIIFSITDFLIEHNVQYINKNPYLKLIKADGKIDEGAETVLTLFAQISESEMRNKKERFARGKKEKSAKGFFVGGPRFVFGYKVDENKKYIVNENEAEIVKKIFHIYDTDETASAQSIKKYFEKIGITLPRRNIIKILSFAGYTGERHTTTILSKNEETQKYEKMTGNERVLPQIISKDLFDRVQIKKTLANTQAEKTENFYFGRRLIKCEKCGRVYGAARLTGAYKCMSINDKSCNNSLAISINVLDTLLYDATISESIISKTKNKEQATTELKNKIADCQKIIDASGIKLSKCDEKKERLISMYADLILSKDEFESRLYKIKDEVQSINNEKRTYEEKIQNYENQILNMDSKSNVDAILNSAKNVLSADDLKEMTDEVHKFIKCVELKRTEINNKKAMYIKMSAFSGNVYEYKSRYSAHYRKHFYYKKSENLISTFDDYCEINPLVVIKRAIGRNWKKQKTNVEIVRNSIENYYTSAFGISTKLR